MYIQDIVIHLNVCYSCLGIKLYLSFTGHFISRKSENWKLLDVNVFVGL